MPHEHGFGRPVLWQSDESLAGEPHVPDRLDVEQGLDEGFHARPGDVRDVAAGDDHVTDGRGLAQVVDHRLEPGAGFEGETRLGDLGGGVADEVHAGAVAAVLRAGGDQFGEDLGGVAVRQPLRGPHVALVQGVPLGLGVGGVVGPAVGEHREHVAAYRIGVVGVGEAVGAGSRDVRGNGVDHVRGDEHGHRGPLALVAVQVGQEAVAERRSGHLAELAEVLDAVGPLPLGGAPLLLRDITPAG